MRSTFMIIVATLQIIACHYVCEYSFLKDTCHLATVRIWGNPRVPVRKFVKLKTKYT